MRLLVLVAIKAPQLSQQDQPPVRAWLNCQRTTLCLLPSSVGSLKLQNPLVLHGSFNRSNIALQVRRWLLLRKNQL